METLLLRPETDSKAVEKAAKLLLAGELVAMPTETVYGLAANALDSHAVARIFEAKGRPQDNPLIVHIAEESQLVNLCPQTPRCAKTLADAFWPGPLTMVVPKGEAIVDSVCCGLDTVGIRMPSHPVARLLIHTAGVPLAAPSANLSGRPSPTTAKHVMHDMNGRIAAVLDGGPCLVGVESTVVSLAGPKPRLLRPGGITLEQLRDVLGEVEADHTLYEPAGENETVAAPGMKYRHYAPNAPVTVVCGEPEQTAAYILEQAGAGCGVLCFDEYRDLFPGLVVESFGGSADLIAQAQHIFDRLRAFDETNVTQIWAQCPLGKGLGLAIANRIQKAAGFQIVRL